MTDERCPLQDFYLRRQTKAPARAVSSHPVRPHDLYQPGAATDHVLEASHLETFDELGPEPGRRSASRRSPR
jgi:hypothetical protein